MKLSINIEIEDALVILSASEYWKKVLDSQSYTAAAKDPHELEIATGKLAKAIELFREGLKAAGCPINVLTLRRSAENFG